MRAPVQKTRPRRTGKQNSPAQAPEGAHRSADSVGSGRPAHVRNRLVIAVAVVAAAVAGAGAPSVLAASSDLRDTRNLVTLAGRTQDALALAHALADERDTVTAYVAAGRPKSRAPGSQQTDRVDRQAAELRAEPDLPAALRSDLTDITDVRRAALTGRSSALDAHQAYTAVITDLHALADQLAERLPPRAGSGAYALAELDDAVQQAAAARGLLLAALNIPRTSQTVVSPVTGLSTTTSTSTAANTKLRDALTAAAQLADVRSDAAIADFRDTAPAAAKDTYDSTVTGPEVNSAQSYLDRLTDQPTLSTSELSTNTTTLDSALTARVELMRGVESSLYEARTRQLAQLRHDDVVALEIRIAVLGALLLVAIGIATALARTLTRPLAVLRLGSARLAADPVAEEPVKFTGRDDEFAAVVRSVNALHAHAVALQERVTTLEGDRKHLIGKRQLMADERDQLRTELAEAAAQLKGIRHTVQGAFVSLALRTLGLVERQLAVIEGLEEREQDPDRLATLFKLDHFATVMRRHSENLLVLAGADHVQQHAGPIPLIDVVRAAVSEIERYDRVRISAIPPHGHLPGFAADDLAHLLAELLENAASFSPPDLSVEISGWLLENGDVMLSVQDEGIGMAAGRMDRLNARLTGFDPEAPYVPDNDGLGLGLYVVARLAHRLGIQVQLRERKLGGVAAVVVLPKSVLATAPPTAVPAQGPAIGGAPTVSLPGADAEVNSNVLPGRSRTTVAAAPEPVEPEAEVEEPAVAEREPEDDPFIAAAERAVRARERAEGADKDTTGADSVVADEEAAPEDEDVPDTAAAPGSWGKAEADEPSPAETTMELLAPVPAADAVVVPAGAEPWGDPPAGEAEPELPQAESAPTADPYAIGPDTHERATDDGGTDHPPAMPRRTVKGLPKRTPHITPEPAAPPRPRAGGVDAEALRRRLGGFHRGAQQGYRHAEAESAERTGETRAVGAPHPPAPPSAAAPEPGVTRGPVGDADVETSGGTVEEASS